MLDTPIINQNLFDMMLQHVGSIDSIHDVCMVNNISLTELDPGMMIEMGSVVNQSVIDYYTEVDHIPANAYQGAVENGVEFEEIEYELIIY